VAGLAATHERRPEELGAAIERLREVMRLALAEMQVLRDEIRPEALEQHPLVELVEHLAALVRARSPLEITFQREDPDPRPSPTDVRYAFYRIAQESLSNVVDHAGATKVEILLKFEPTLVTLRIRDNGHGFNPRARAATRGRGIRTMRDHAAVIGARLRIDSEAGKGTEVVLEWPRMDAPAVSPPPAPAGALEDGPTDPGAPR